MVQLTGKLFEALYIMIASKHFMTATYRVQAIWQSIGIVQHASVEVNWDDTLELDTVSSPASANICRKTKKKLLRPTPTTRQVSGL